MFCPWLTFVPSSSVTFSASWKCRWHYAIREDTLHKGHLIQERSNLGWPRSCCTSTLTLTSNLSLCTITATVSPLVALYFEHIPLVWKGCFFSPLWLAVSEKAILLTLNHFDPFLPMTSNDIRLSPKYSQPACTETSLALLKLCV